MKSSQKFALGKCSYYCRDASNTIRIGMSLYLITGGAGFIGSHLADALIAEGHRVRVLDDLSTGMRANAIGHVRGTLI